MHANFYMGENCRAYYVHVITHILYVYRSSLHRIWERRNLELDRRRAARTGKEWKFSRRIRTAPNFGPESFKWTAIGLNTFKSRREFCRKWKAIHAVEIYADYFLLSRMQGVRKCLRNESIVKQRNSCCANHCHARITAIVKKNLFRIREKIFSKWSYPLDILSRLCFHFHFNKGEWCSFRKRLRRLTEVRTARILCNK